MHPDFPFHFPFFSYCFFSPSIFCIFHYFSILCRFFFWSFFPPRFPPRDFQSFCLCGPLFTRTSMLSSSIYRSLSTAQHSAINLAQRSTASTCRSERDNASKQAQLASASMSLKHLQLAVFSKRTKIEICPALKKYAAANHKTACGGVIARRTCFACISNIDKKQHCSFSPSFSSMCFVHACGVRDVFLEPWSSWQLQFVSSHLSS